MAKRQAVISVGLYSTLSSLRTFWPIFPLLSLLLRDGSVIVLLTSLHPDVFHGVFLVPLQVIIPDVTYVFGVCGGMHYKLTWLL